MQLRSRGHSCPSAPSAAALDYVHFDPAVRQPSLAQLVVVHTVREYYILNLEVCSVYQQVSNKSCIREGGGGREGERRRERLTQQWCSQWPTIESLYHGWLLLQLLLHGTSILCVAGQS